MSSLQAAFVNSACQQVKFGPSSVSDFTKWRVSPGCVGTFWTFLSHLLSCKSSLTLPFVSVGSQVEILAKEYLSSLTKPKEEAESSAPTDTKENCVRFPTSAASTTLFSGSEICCVQVPMLGGNMCQTYFRMFQLPPSGNKPCQPPV